MARKPNVATEVIVKALFEAEDGTLTARDLGITSARATALVNSGVLVQRKGTQKVMDGDKAGRGRPRRLFSLSRKVKDRAKREAAKASA